MNRTLLHEHEQAVLRVLRDLVEPDAANVEVLPPEGIQGVVIRLVPRNSAASHVELHFGPPFEAQLSLGKYSAIYEIDAESELDLVATIRSVVGAVVTKGYEETVWLYRGKPAKIEAALPLASGTEGFLQRHLGVPLEGAERRTLKYAPY